MSRISYINGRYVPHVYASTHIEDRGYQFADGVYEVVALIKGRLVDLDPHLDRLDYSLSEIRIPQPVTRETLKHIIHEVVRQNRLTDGMIYVQVSRGVAPRYHGFPKESHPVLVVTAKYVDHEAFFESKKDGVRLISLPEIRWARPDIKSISLLPNVLGKQQAVDQGAYEGVLVGVDGMVTETNSTNIWIVNKDGDLQTHPQGRPILNGITRIRILSLAREKGWKVIEKPFTLDELYGAREAFLSASVSGILPVVQVDDRPIAGGQPGPVVQALRENYREFVHDDRH